MGGGGLAFAILALSGGTAAPDDTAVVGIYDSMTGATCTGSLIAANLVLTAQHCVAELTVPFDCATEFAAPRSPNAFSVTTGSTFSFDPSAYHSVAEILVPPGQGFCGRDFALMILSDVVPSTEATPLEPRVAETARAGEEYRAVGFGATDDFGAESGERRRRDGLTVACAGAQCGTPLVAAEWRGEAGVCVGDSGGPALDVSDRVIGVASRGSVGCSDPVYEDVFAHAAWLIEEAKRAASLGGYVAPAWAEPDPPEDPIPPEVDDGGCRAAPGRTRGAGLVAVALAWALALALSSRRCRPTRSR